MKARLCANCLELSALPGELNCAECGARGAPRLVEHVTMVECLACAGTGAARSATSGEDWRSAVGMAARQCFDCGGTGSVSESQRRSQAVLEREQAREGSSPLALEQCPGCDGDGCRFCAGQGEVPAAKAEAIRDLLT